MKVQAPYFPIVYVRGFAATRGEIEDTVATPYMGFNLGATKVRQDHRRDVVRLVFESPLLRLIKDHGYTDTYQQGDLIDESEEVSARSIWIFRYYEPVSTDLGSGERKTIPEFAVDLRRFILRIRASVCGRDPVAREAFRVHLTAHSMGGLICRAYLQNICRRGAGDADVDEKLELPGDPLVDKVFTYATPHGGIDFGGRNVPDLGALDPVHVRNFNRVAMRSYLKIEPDGDVTSLDGAFPPKRFFSLIGTNYRDYTAFFGLSQKAAGEMSDGLVRIKNAAVRHSPRAFVHRAHSGHFGIVNSEEGYQNLRRFLFGEAAVRIRLATDEVTLPKEVEAQKKAGRNVEAAYLIETSAKVRGALCYLNQRRVDHSSAIHVDHRRLSGEGRPVLLFSGYLLEQAKMKQARDTALAFALSVSIQVPLFEVERRFWLDTHFEGATLFEETISFHLRRGRRGLSLHYGLASRHGAGVAPSRLAAISSDGEPRESSPAVDGEEREEGEIHHYELPVGFKAGLKRPPRPGFRGRLLVEIEMDR